eukprot:TRINITY_DN66664_c0_g1_i1.p1 TRINITY_DN66664_c0_g1~~TRINITY_DN66664_c0_g1_i1.p1  ORF type:complete len:522 (-),score=123.55 TRINITY_DN66664_c0_g1_i1:331-1896(-)
MKFSNKVVGAALAAAAVTLQGCGDKDTPAGARDCPADLKRGHCTGCYYSGGENGVYTCTGCSSPYALESDNKTCSMSCDGFKTEEMPSMPDSPATYNGKAWAPLCIEGKEEHFYAIGDWGGVCNWNNGNKCQKGFSPISGEVPDAWKDKVAGMPFPMNNRKEGVALQTIDYFAQQMVADRMRNRTQELKKMGKKPQFIINVGDNFYPGGLETHCGNTDQTVAFSNHQFAQIFENVYPTEHIGNIEWWSVLGNHDYGGVCYLNGWDQQIYYTWKPDGRWIMPAQYWSRHVQFKTFDVDFWFLDSNIVDIYQDPTHNICSKNNNPGDLCKPARLPGIPEESCGAVGPKNPDDCKRWFRDLWKGELRWFRDGLKKSRADWQIVVLHHPPTHTPGDPSEGTVLNWKSYAKKYGIDLIISGHQHNQRIYYKDTPRNGFSLEDTAWVITGGGGGITSEEGPLDNGFDGSYGFMDMKINLTNIQIASFTHGGLQGKMIVWKNVTVAPRERTMPYSEDDEEQEEAIAFV